MIGDQKWQYRWERYLVKRYLKRKKNWTETQRACALRDVRRKMSRWVSEQRVNEVIAALEAA